MPRKIRELVRDLLRAQFQQIPGGGKGSHRKFVHASLPGSITISGRDGDDAKPYQEKQVENAIKAVDEND